MSLPSGFVRLSEFAPTILLDMRYVGSNNFLGQPVDGYLANEAIVTRPTAEALLKIQSTLKPLNLSLIIFDAYRPLTAVDHFQRWALEAEDPQIAARFHPHLSKAAIFEQGYIATRSSHTRGSTVDLSVAALTEQDYECLDMGTEFDFFGADSATYYPSLIPQQRANRLLLRQLMEGQGFIGFDLEWWHFTLQNEPYPNQYFDFPVR